MGKTPRDRGLVAALAIALLALLVAGVALAVALQANGGASDAAASPGTGTPAQPGVPIVPGPPGSGPSPSASPTFGGRSIDLSLPGFGGVAVDAANGHLFVSGGSESNEVVVLDLRGTIVKRLDGLLGASGMVVHGSRLYVALHNADGVAVFDTATLEPIEVLDTTPKTRPHAVTWVNDELWVSRGDCAGVVGEGLFALDPSTGRISDLPQAVSGSECPTVIPLPGDPKRVIVSSAIGTGVFQVKSDRLRTILQVPGGSVSPAAVSPDGRFALVPANDRAASFGVDTLEPSGTDYVAEPYVAAIDTTDAPEPRVVVGSDAIYGKDVRLYHADDPQPYATFDFGETGPANQLYLGGVVFSPDGDRVFAFTGNTGNNAGDDVFLRILRT